MSKAAVEWLENDPASPYRLGRCELLSRAITYEGSSVEYFIGRYGEGRAGNAWMFCLKPDDEAGASMHWTADEPEKDHWTGDPID